PEKRILQAELAKEVTGFVHGKEEYEKAVETTAKLFANANAPAESLSLDELEGMEGVQKFEYSLEKIKNGVDIVSFLSETGIFSSKGEARKMIQQGGVSINRKKVSVIEFEINSGLLLHDRYLLAQKGKKNHYLIEIH